MERRYSALLLVVLVTALELSMAAAGAFRCERRPKDVSGDPQPVNGRYRLEFSGKGNTYVPDHTYRGRVISDVMVSAALRAPGGQEAPPF
ncbi:Protein of unknown function [Gryllus bimaculatus]|nr:Protein of unknown function [Gryllus bimaculatus]